MKIKRNLSIYAIKLAKGDHSPFHIILEGAHHLVGQMETKWPSIRLNWEAMSRLELPLDFSLVGKKLECEFETLGLGEIQKENPDIVRLASLDNHRHVTLFRQEDRQQNRIQDRYVLSLESPCDGGSISIMPSPYYHFPLELTKDEFDECVRSLTYSALLQVRIKLAA